MSYHLVFHVSAKRYSSPFWKEISNFGGLNFLKTELWFSPMRLWECGAVLLNIYLNISYLIPMHGLHVWLIWRAKAAFWEHSLIFITTNRRRSNPCAVSCPLILRGLVLWNCFRFYVQVLFVKCSGIKFKLQPRERGLCKQRVSIYASEALKEWGYMALKHLYCVFLNFINLH